MKRCTDGEKDSRVAAMKKLLVTCEVTISMNTEVSAPNTRTAKEKALERGMVSLCYQCGGSQTGHKEWVTSGELDGEPTNLRVEELE